MERYYVLEAVLSRKSYKHLLVPLHHHTCFLPSLDILIDLLAMAENQELSIWGPETLT